MTKNRAPEIEISNSQTDKAISEIQNNRQIKYYEVIIGIPDSIFYPLVSKRLNIMLKPLELQRFHLKDEDREYWTIEYLRENLFKQMASTKEIITYKGTDVTVHKYFAQASRLWRWIPIARPPPEFVVNISDLSPKTILELKCLDRIDYNYVIKRAVGQIFEYIDPQTYRKSLAKNLRVRLDR